MKIFFKIVVWLAFVAMGGFLLGSIMGMSDADWGTLFGLPAALIAQIPWYLSRSSAIAAYVTMFMVIVLGAGMTTGFAYRFINPIRAWTIHKYLSISLGVMVLIHMISLLFDRFIGFKTLDLLVPFHATYKPVYVSMGILGFYILLAVTASSLMIRLKHPVLWRWIHYSVYPLFAVSLVHGLYLGTDSKTYIMQSFYWTTGVIGIGVVLYRFIAFPIVKRKEKY